MILPETQDARYEDFSILKKIGRGGFASVYLVTKRGCKDHFAMKVLSKKQIIKERQVEHIMTERNCYAKLTSPFIVDMKYAFQTDKKLIFVMDFVVGGELLQYIHIVLNNTKNDRKHYRL